MFAGLRKSVFLLLFLAGLLLVCGCGPDTTTARDSEPRAATDSKLPSTTVKIINPGAKKPRTRNQAPAQITRATQPMRGFPTATTCPMVQVTGRVMFEDGSPLSSRVSSPTVELWTAARDGVAAQAERRLDVGRIGENGRYVVAGPDGPNLRVEVNGISRAIADLDDPDDGATTEPRVREIKQDFLVPAPYTVSGRVTNAQGDPVTSAVVSLRSEDVKTDGWYYGNQQTTVTAAGEFTLEGVATGAATIGAAAPGFSAVTREISVPTSGPINLRMTTGTATVNGHVLMFPEDTPVAGAKVSIRETGNVRTLGLAAKFRPTAVTGADGSFSLAQLAAGQYSFTVTDSDGTELFKAPGKENQDAMRPTLLDDQTTGITLRVFPGYTVSGLVFDKDTSDPLSGARVTAYRASTPMVESVTKADGQFELNGIGSDWDSDIGVVLDGFMISPSARLSFQNRRSPAMDVAYPADSTRVTLDVPMVAVVRVSGRVENKDGLPVPNARIDWNANNMYPSTREHNQVTDADGRFAFTLYPFQQGLFEVTAEGYAFKRSDEVNLTSLDRNDIVIVLDTGAEVEGRVVSPEGKGVAGAAISIRDHYSIGFTSMMSMRPLSKSGVDGSFRVANLPAQQNVRLNATAEGYSPGLAVVHLQPGDMKTGVEIKLGEELTVEGRVIDAEDQPVRASIHAGFSASNSQVQTDQAGAFKLGGLSPGEVELFVMPHGGGLETITTKVPKKDLVIRIGDESCTGYCTVVDSVTMKPIEKYEVNGAGRVEQVGPGKFTVKLEPGSMYTPEISAEGYVKRTFKIEAPKEGGDFELTLQMGIGSGVSGRVLSASGEPAAGVPLAVYETEYFQRMPVGTSVSGQDGKFLISKVPAGKVSVRAMPPAPAASVSKTVDLKDGEFQDVGDLVIGQVGGMRGRVIRVPSGEPLPKAYVNVNGVGEGERYYKLVVAGDDGAFELTDLQPRTYSVTVDGHVLLVDVRSGETAEVIVDLGSVTLQGIVTMAGVPTAAQVKVTNKATGRGASAMASGESGKYRLAGLVAGDYDVVIVPMRTREDGSTFGNGSGQHTETISVPDQTEAVKDFAL